MGIRLPGKSGPTNSHNLRAASGFIYLRNHAHPALQASCGRLLSVRYQKEDTRPMRVARVFVFWGVALALNATAAFAAGDLKATLAKLDAAAAKFQSTAADFQFDSVMTDPIPEIG